MNKTSKTLIIVTLTILIMTSNVANSGNLTVNAQIYPTGIAILVFNDAALGSATTFNGLKANFTNADNTVTIVNQTNWDFTTDSLAEFDALFVNVKDLHIFDTVTNPEVLAIKTWFDSGDKLLWVGGDDDFGGFWLANNTNPLLEALGTPLRFDAGGIQDLVSNDNGGSYRVMANATGVSSSLVDYVTTGFEIMPFHAPSAINYDNDGEIVDLRNMRLPPNIHIVINSSQHAYALDQDFSQNNDDLYVSIDEESPLYHGVSGSYPFLVVDGDVSNSSSMLVVSGELVYSDRKNMYGNTWERQTELKHQGSLVVDNLLSYYFVEGYIKQNETISISPTETVTTSTGTPTLTTTSTTTSTTTPVSTTITVSDDFSTSETSENAIRLPLPNVGFFVGLIVLVAIIKRSNFWSHKK